MLINETCWYLHLKFRFWISKLLLDINIPIYSVTRQSVVAEFFYEPKFTKPTDFIIYMIYVLKLSLMASTGGLSLNKRRENSDSC